MNFTDKTQLIKALSKFINESKKRSSKHRNLANKQPKTERPRTDKS